MRASLIGTPSSGKSTVFQALTGIEQTKKEEQIGTLKVPDERIDRLSDIYSPKKKTYAEFVLSDYNIPASKDSLIPAKVKNLIQKADLIIFVLRNFESAMIGDPADALSEYRKLKDEIIISDFMVVEKRLEREQKENKNPPELNILKKFKEMLDKGQFPERTAFTDDEIEVVANYNFLCLKKRIALINQPEGEMTLAADLTKALDADDIVYFSVSASLEKELSQLDPAEQIEFLKGYGLTETARERFIKKAYSSLGLISFLTAGEDEVRAWPIKAGTVAVEAAGKIHSDISRGFIRAETIDFETFIKHGSESECKKAGVFRLEGKEYTVRDGDIINFRFNV